MIAAGEQAGEVSLADLVALYDVEARLAQQKVTHILGRTPLGRP